MPIFPVPPGAKPGILDGTTFIGLESICDVGSKVGTLDGSVAAWVQVCIKPVSNADNTGPVTPDASGRYLHVCIEFSQPTMWRGKRRRQVPGFSTTDEPAALFVECDPGWFWIGTLCQFHATGGTPGDLYDITMTVATMQQEADARLAANDAPPIYQVDLFEPPCKLRLTALSTAVPDEPNVPLPTIPDHHSLFRLVAGTCTWGGVTFTSPTGGKSIWLPLDAPITTGMNTIYQTGGAL